MTLLIDRLVASAYGAIPTTCTLDLSAPLTVLYAPNGTGKTSLVEAIDWVFQGTEFRDPRCALAKDDAETAVSLFVRRGETMHRFSKALDSAGNEVRRIDQAPAKVTEFLRALAPDCDVSNLNHKTQISHLSAYLSSNRVLSVQALAGLIDTQDADRRADAMGDFLGTRVQRNAQKQIELYRSRLDERRKGLAKEHSAVRTRIDTLSTRAAALVSVDIEPLWNAAAAGLGLQPDSETEPNRRKSVLAGAIATQKTNLAQMRSAVEGLQGFLHRPFPNEVADAKEKSLSETMTRLESLSRRHEEAVARCDQDASALRRFQDLASTALEAHGASRILLNECRKLPEEGRVSDFEIFRSTVGSKFASWASARQAMTSWSFGESELDVQTQSLSQVESQIRALRESQGTPAEQQAEQARLQALRARLTEDESHAQSLTTLKAELSTLAAKVHSLDHSSRCPVCDHGWKDHAALGEAIKRASGTVPLSLKAASTRLTQARSEAADLAKRVGDRAAAGNQLAIATRERGALNTKLEQTKGLRIAFAWNSTTPPTPSDMEALATRISCIELYESLLVRISEYSNTIGTQREDSITDLVSKIATWTTSTVDTRDRLKKQLEKSSVDLEVASKALNAARLERERLERELQQARSDSVRLASHLDRLQLSGLSEDGVLAARRDCEKLEVAVAVAEEAIGAIVQGVERSSVGSELSGLSVREEQLRQCVSKLGVEIDRSRINDSTIQATVALRRSSIVDSLSPAVSELFQRMQVNRVFGGVEFDSDLQLRGLLGDKEVDPNMFSSGQRQDLALAFFLVRAYALGGTFVLDEPLVHLDDLNRVALLDTLRGFVVSASTRSNVTRLVLTTASWATARHLCEKFMRLDRDAGGPHRLRVLQLSGNVTTSVSCRQVYPSPSQSQAHAN